MLFGFFLQGGFCLNNEDLFDRVQTNLDYTSIVYSRKCLNLLYKSFIYSSVWIILVYPLDFGRSFQTVFGQTMTWHGLGCQASSYKARGCVYSQACTVPS